MKVFHLLSSFRYGGAARQAMLLARGLRGESDQVVCVLGQTGPWAQVLADDGIPVHALDWSRAMDPMPLWRLRTLVRDFRPDRIHAWGMPALRSLALVAGASPAKTIVSRAAPVHMARPGWNTLDRWLLQRVRLLTARGPAEMSMLQRLGIAPHRIVLLPLAAPIVEPGSARRDERHVVCVGPFKAGKGFTHSLWAADYLGYAFDDVQVSYVGAGPEEQKLRRFLATTMVFPRAVRFAGEMADPRDLLSRASVCWVPSLTGSGMQTAVEAQAAGCPVIVSDAPLLKDTIHDGETGLVALAGKQISLARRTRKLFVDEDMRARLGDNARRHARDNFSIEALLEQGRALYAA